MLQWNLSNTETFGTKKIVLINEVSIFQGENNMYLYKVGTRSSVLINQVSLFQGCLLRGVPLYLRHLTLVCWQDSGLTFRLVFVLVGRRKATVVKNTYSISHNI